MMEPPPALRIGSTAYLIPRNTARKSTAMVRSQSSALMASIGPVAPTKPALLNMMSRRPYSLTARSTADLMAGSLDTSVC